LYNQKIILGQREYNPRNQIYSWNWNFNKFSYVEDTKDNSREDGRMNEWLG